jgi:hypothetical protein
MPDAPKLPDNPQELIGHIMKAIMEAHQTHPYNQSLALSMIEGEIYILGYRYYTETKTEEPVKPSEPESPLKQPVPTDTYYA